MKTFDDAPEQRLAEGFATRVARWSREAGAAPADAAAAGVAARHASLATSAGHVCVGLAEVAQEAGLPDAAALAQVLKRSGVAGTNTAPGTFPLVVDGEGRLYLHRYFDYERRLARRLVQAAAQPPREPGAAVADRLATLFPQSAATAPDWQQLGAALALRQGLAILSGGPGTGKTTTVVNLLACLLEQEPQCRIALAAPTGKAAARMTEAVRQRAQHLPRALREKLPAEASTLQRLLRYQPSRGFEHDATRPLPLDVLVVDEASMLDLALATHLLEAVPPSARIVLVGDQHQLAAVESGAVFAELAADPTLGPDCAAALERLCGLPAGNVAAPPPQRAGTLRDAVVWLTRNYRFAAGSGIGRLAAAINAGDAAGALQWLQAGGDASVLWQGQPAQGTDSLCALGMQAYGPYLEAVRRDPRDVAAVSAAFAAFRVLCAVREGPQGMAALNDALDAAARAALARADGPAQVNAASPWYVGRPVMVLVNDYALRLFNGDIGIALPDAGGRLVVWFPEPGGAGWRAVAPARMPRHETAFATTVHKSQGSEFDEVMVVLPARDSRVATRELLYTAVTRAKAKVRLCAPADTLAAAIARTAERRSGLLARLREAAA